MIWIRSVARRHRLAGEELHGHTENGSICLVSRFNFNFPENPQNSLCTIRFQLINLFIQFRLTKHFFTFIAWMGAHWIEVKFIFMFVLLNDDITSVFGLRIFSIENFHIFFFFAMERNVAIHSNSPHLVAVISNALIVKTNCWNSKVSRY